jgi:vancomycin permeability regulator SanA
MSNPLYTQMGGGMPMNNIMQRFQQFQQMFKGDPRQQVQNLLNSGRVSQSQYDQAVKMAQNLQRMMGK